MSAIILIGIFTVTWWFFDQTKVSLFQLFEPFKSQISHERDSNKIFELLKFQVPYALLGGSIKHQMYQPILFFKQKNISAREAILMLALSPLSLLITSLFSLIVLQINGWFVVGVSAIVVVLLNRAKYVRIVRYFKWIIGLGLFLSLFEFLLKQQGLFQTAVGEDIIFWLVDARAFNLLLFLFSSLLITFLLQIENWSLVFTLFLLLTGLTSVSGAMSWILGETLAWVFIVVWQTRSFAQFSKFRFHFLLLWCVAIFLSFLMLGYAKDFILLFESNLEISLWIKIIELFVLQLASIGIQLVVMMGWGHFAALKSGLE